MAQSDTAERILHAAPLFAERGFAKTSLRTITVRADVNLAAEQLPRCMFESLIVSTEEIHEDPRIIMRLLGLAYTQSQEHLRVHIFAIFGDTYGRFVNLLREICPGTESVEYYWRLYFMLGPGVLTLSSFDSIRSILNAEYQKDADLRSTVDMMITPLARMLIPTNAQ